MYADIPDQDFADKFHQKFYSDMDRGEFYQKINYSPLPALGGFKKMAAGVKPALEKEKVLAEQAQEAIQKVGEVAPEVVPSPGIQYGDIGDPFAETVGMEEKPTPVLGPTKEQAEALARRSGVEVEPGLGQPTWGDPINIASVLTGIGAGPAMAGAGLKEAGKAALRSIPGVLGAETGGAVAAGELEKAPPYVKIPAELALATAGGMATSKLARMASPTVLRQTFAGGKPVLPPREVFDAEIQPFLSKGVSYGEAIGEVAKKYGTDVNTLAEFLRPAYQEFAQISGAVGARGPQLALSPDSIKVWGLKGPIEIPTKDLAARQKGIAQLSEQLDEVDKLMAAKYPTGYTLPEVEEFKSSIIQARDYLARPPETPKPGYFNPYAPKIPRIDVPQERLVPRPEQPLDIARPIPTSHEIMRQRLERMPTGEVEMPAGIEPASHQTPAGWWNSLGAKGRTAFLKGTDIESPNQYRKPYQKLGGDQQVKIQELWGARPRQVQTPSKPSAKIITEDLMGIAEDKGIQQMHSGGPSTRAIFSPTDVAGEINPISKTKMLLINYHGERASEFDRGAILVDKAAREAGLRHLMPNEYMKFLKQEVSAYQRGGEITDKTRNFINTYNELREPLEQAIQEIKPDWQMRENYFRQMFETRGQAWRDFMTRNKSSLEGPKGFFKQKKYMSWEDGLEAGLKPKYSNVADIVKADLAEKRHFVEGYQVFKRMKEEGLAEFLPSGSQLPPGKGFLEDRRFKVSEFVDRPGGFAIPPEALEEAKSVGETGYQWVPGVKGFMPRGRYIADKPIADLVNSQFEPGIQNRVFKAAIKATNTVRQLKVFGPFHFWFTDATSRAITNEMLALTEGKIPGLKTAESLIPLGSERTRRLGSKIQEAWLTPGKHGPEFDEAVQNLVEGGQRFRYDPRGIIRNLGKESDNFGNILKDAYIDTLHDLKGLRVDKVLGRALDGITAPIMKYQVPQVKLGIHQIITQPEHAALKAKFNVGANGKTTDTAMQKAYETERMFINQKASKFVDNAFGQMVKENIFMSNVWKDILSIGIQFPTWNIGNFNIMGAVGKAGWEMLTQQPLSLQSKMATRLATGLLINAGITGSLIHRTMTGEWPTTFKDVYMPVIDPKSGDRLIQGTYLRSMMAWGSHPIRTMGHMKNIAIGMTWDIMNNKDFQNARIWTPHAPTTQKIGEFAQYTGEQLQPILFSQFERGTSPATTYAGLVGWQKPAAYLTNTELEQTMSDLARGGITKTRYEADFLRTEKKMLDVAKRDKPKFAAEMTKALSDKKISEAQALRIINKAKVEPLIGKFRNLDVQDMIRAFPYASEKEKPLILPAFMKRLANTLKKEPQKIEPLRHEINDIVDSLTKIKPKTIQEIGKRELENPEPEVEE